MIIPKQYGGLEFSAYAHSCVLAKIASRSADCLLHRRGAQLARARGAAAITTAPRSRRTTTCRASRAARKCPASRSPGRARAPMPPRFPTPASSAAACWQGREILGLRLNFSKRYITLAPVATVIGLAFRMFDPEQLLGETTRHRHHLRADSARHAGAHHRAAAFPAQHSFPERPDPGQGRVRAARCHHRRHAHGGPGLAHAGRAALGRALHLAALERHRRRARPACWATGRLRAHPPPVQHAGRRASRASRP